MSAPLCPKMLHLLPSRYREVDSEMGWRQVWDGEPPPEQCRCRGSECALWVPELQREGVPYPVPMTDAISTRHAAVIAGRYTQMNGMTYSDDKCELTGRGWCSENLRRQPWTDPAADNDNGAADGGGEDA